MKSIRIDRRKRLKDEPHIGHNRWHPDIAPALEVNPGEEVLLETRDAFDGQIREGMTVQDLESIDNKVAHPLTGPVYINGATPGDLLDVEFLDIVPESYGVTRIKTDGGFLEDLFPEPYLAHWNIENNWATSAQLPDVRIPGSPFMGTAGIAPSHAQLQEWTRREQELSERGHALLLPDPEDAVPAEEPICSEGLRTIPPRENCGNVDAKQWTRGCRLHIPVNVEGALFSTGDAHFAQGDGESCITAIEMGATTIVRFQIRKGEAARLDIRWPRFSHSDYFAPPQWAVPRNWTATMGMPIRSDGTQEAGDLNLATRNALLNMIDLLGERGWSRQQAYVICSVAVDLRLSNIVNRPNLTVSAFLPEDIFHGADGNSP